MKKFYTLTAVLVIAVCGFVTLCFTGCGETPVSYSQFQQNYADFVKKYENEIFDENGYVSINYKNSLMRAEIAKTDITAKQNGFTRLSNNAKSDQAIFEPTFKATLLPVKRYITVQGNMVPENKSTELNNLLSDLASKIDSFLVTKTVYDILKQDNVEKFVANGGMEQFYLSELFDKFLDMLRSSVKFGQNFLDVYEEYISVKAPDIGDRVGQGKITNFYMSKMLQIADIYVEGKLSKIYNVVKVENDVELITAAAPAGDINSVMEDYFEYVNAFSEFESNRDVPLTQNGLLAIKTYKTAVKYDPIFEKGLNVALEILPKINTEATISSSEQAYLDLVNQFMLTEYKNMSVYLNKICEYIASA